MSYQQLNGSSFSTKADPTAGPWSAFFGTNGRVYVSRRVGAHYENPVCELLRVDEYSPAREMANGALIASAPDLLAACRKVELLADEWRKGRCTSTDLADALTDLSASTIRPAIGRSEGIDPETAAANAARYPQS